MPASTPRQAPGGFRPEPERRQAAQQRPLVNKPPSMPSLNRPGDPGDSNPETTLRGPAPV